MARDLLERPRDGEVLIDTGPIHTLLEQETGRNLEGHLSEWIVNHPNEFQSVVKAQFAAGCDFGTPGTQRNGRYRLREFGLEDRLYELTLKQVQLAKEVTPENCYLVGHLGMTGRFLEPVGDMTVDELYKSFVEQTIPMLEAGVDVVGALWGDIARPIGNALTTVKEMRQSCDKPLSIRPDAGLAQLIDGKIVQPLTPEEMGREVPGWIAAGASIVGGCCGTSLEYIKAITAAAKGKK